MLIVGTLVAIPAIQGIFDELGVNRRNIASSYFMVCRFY